MYDRQKKRCRCRCPAAIESANLLATASRWRLVARAAHTLHHGRRALRAGGGRGRLVAVGRDARPWLVDGAGRPHALGRGVARILVERQRHARRTRRQRLARGRAHRARRGVHRGVIGRASARCGRQTCATGSARLKAAVCQDTPAWPQAVAGRRAVPLRRRVPPHRLRTTTSRRCCSTRSGRATRRCRSTRSRLACTTARRLVGTTARHLVGTTACRLVGTTAFGRPKGTAPGGTLSRAAERRAAQGSRHGTARGC